MPAIKALLTTGVAYLRSIGAGAGTGSIIPAGKLHSDVTQAATGANTDLTTLATYTLPANTLNRDGMAIRILAFGKTGETGNTKNFFITLGGDTVLSRSSSGNNVGWWAEAIIVRTGSGTYDYTGNSTFGTSASAATPAAASEDFTTALTITVKGLNGTAAAGDCVLDGWVIEVLQ
jgi:hypothetical protein